MFLLVNNLHEKRIPESQHGRHNFFMHIITEQIRFIAPW